MSLILTDLQFQKQFDSQLKICFPLTKDFSFRFISGLQISNLTVVHDIQFSKLDAQSLKSYSPPPGGSTLGILFLIRMELNKEAILLFKIPIYQRESYSTFVSKSQFSITPLTYSYDSLRKVRVKSLIFSNLIYLMEIWCWFEYSSARWTFQMYEDQISIFLIERGLRLRLRLLIDKEYERSC